MTFLSRQGERQIDRRRVTATTIGTFIIETYSLPALARGYLATLPSISAHPIRSILTFYFFLSKIRATADFVDRKLPPEESGNKPAAGSPRNHNEPLNCAGTSNVEI